MVPRDAWHVGGMLVSRERLCSRREDERQIIIFLLEIGGVLALCGEKNLDMFVELPVLLPENGREKR